MHTEGLKGDLHVHTNASPDYLIKATYSLEDACEAARSAGFGVVAITEHGRLHPYDQSQQAADRADVILIPAVEIRALINDSFRAQLIQNLGFSPHRAWVDVLAYGVTDAIPDEEWSIQQVVEEIHKQNGLAVLAHPSGAPGINWYSSFGKQAIRDLGIDGIEALNASIPQFMNRNAQRLARELGLPVTGGSDTRRLDGIGKGLTVFNPDLTIDTWEDCLSTIRNKQTAVEGEGIRLGPFFA